METCRWCGARVLEGTTVCPACGVRLRRESTDCPECKREIRVGLAVCPHCGEELAKRRIPWKLIGSLGGVALAAVVVYAAVSILPLPINLPFVAAPPSPTPTEVILPPTETPTETPRPPTAIPTATATFTPVITATATTVGTATPVESPISTETLTATPTEAPVVKYPAPQLIGPEDQTGWPPDRDLLFSSGSIIELSWEPVGALAENEWYAVSLTYTDKNGEPARRDRWTRDTTWPVGQDLYELLGGDREVRWNIAVVWDRTGLGEGAPISPPSETRMFRWG
jgi:RNA polymerase subunit RPABC4/transcription elongation factor Spt4